MTRRLYVFDMDGTLLPNSTANLEIAKVTKTERELSELEASFVAGHLTTYAFAERIHSLWGQLAEGLVRAAYDAASKLRNIAEVTSQVADEGGVSCLITMSPDYFARHFSELGFDAVFASTFPSSATAPLDIARILAPKDKPLLAQRFATECGLDFEHSVAFGDSMSDYPLFECLKHTVSINGDAKLEKVARWAYRGDDLLEAFQMVRSNLRLLVAPTTPTS